MAHNSAGNLLRDLVCDIQESMEVEAARLTGVATYLERHIEDKHQKAVEEIDNNTTNNINIASKDIADTAMEACDWILDQAGRIVDRFSTEGVWEEILRRGGSVTITVPPPTPGKEKPASRDWKITRD